MRSRAEQLFDRGQSVWLDFIRRGHLRSGEFDALVREAGVVGVTSNPTIFQQAIADSDDYEEGIRAGVADGLEGPALFEALAIEDIQSACDRLRAVYERTRGVDGRVSIEVSPRLAHDTAGTIEEARRLHRRVARPNLYVKVPATREGLPAISALIGEGISINVTLIFSLARYDEVMEAYLAGLERRAAQGQPLAGVHSVASFFVSRVDSKVDKAIEARAGALAAGAAERDELLGLRGRTAIANARLAYARFREVFGGSRFRALREKGANLQRPLWASTSTKNPDYPDTLYVDELIGADTVNTMPLATLEAVNDHGATTARIEHDLDGAKTLFRRLPELGVPLDRLIGELEGEGVAAFAKSYDALLEALEEERRKVAPRALGAAPRVTAPSGAAGAVAALGPIAATVDERLIALDRERFAERLWRRDDALWGDDPAHRAVAANRLGWLSAPEAMRREVAALRAFAAEVAADGHRHAVLLGMGGSSLAPEVLRLTFGVAAGALDLTVLDNTSPAAVRAVAEAHDPARTLFIVASKSGGTIEVASFERHFFERARAALGDRAGRSFVAITDPGTPLEALARERGYRRTFLNPPDIGGRYSALSFFGLVPAALIGVDLEAMLDGAIAEARANGPGVAAAQSPGLALGATMGEAARAGRDKLTLVLGPGLEAVGAWIEQLVAESTGKSGRGIVPVVGEPLVAATAYGADRLFVAATLGPAPASLARALDALGEAGHPVVRWELPVPAALGAEFLRWEIATAVAGAVLGVDPFDEPNVTEAKKATSAVLERFVADGRLPERAAIARAHGVAVEAPEALAKSLGAPADDPAAWVGALARLAGPGDYVAVLAYLHATDARLERLERLRRALGRGGRIATTLGIGPRFLHSTGQLHKGGAANGVFLQLVADEGAEVEIPGERWGFGTLRDAQAIGDYEVLVTRGRRVVRVHLGDAPERALDRLIAAAESAGR